MVMLGVHTVLMRCLVKTLDTEGGAFDNEPNTLQLRSFFTEHERASSSVHTAPIDAVTLAASAGPKELMVVVDHVSSAGHVFEGRSKLQAVEGSPPPAYCQASHLATIHAVAMAFLAPSMPKARSDEISCAGLMPGAHGAGLVRVPGIPSWNPDVAEIISYMSASACLARILDPSPWNLDPACCRCSLPCTHRQNQLRSYAKSSRHLPDQNHGPTLLESGFCTCYPIHVYWLHGCLPEALSLRLP